jgi:hypothetical protein
MENNIFKLEGGLSIRELETRQEMSIAIDQAEAPEGVDAMACRCKCAESAEEQPAENKAT